jgi:acetyl esterase
MLDPQMAALLEVATAAGMPPDFRAMGPAAAKAASKLSGAQMGQGPEVARIENLTIPGPQGPIGARLYTPNARPRGLIVFFHGGGWVVSDLDGYDPCVRRLASQAECAVLSVDYRMAPEFPFPAPLEDCYAAARWAGDQVVRLAGWPVPLMVAGDSAGGNLSAAVALLARDRSRPTIDLQVLIYPVTDADFETQSYKDFDKGYLLTADAMTWFWEQYVPDVENRANPLASPLRAKSLKGLPAALVESAGYDPLRDEGEAYAARLEREGVPTVLRRWSGLTHGFFQFAMVLEPAGLALDAIAYDIRARLSTQATSHADGA